MKRLLVFLTVMVVTACGTVSDLLPPRPERLVINETPVLPTPTPGSVTLSPDGFRTTERVAVRVRNVGCDGVSIGSGFAISSNRLVTNRHVVAGATTLQVSTYDGQDLLVEASGTAVLADIAIVETSSPLPAAVELAASDPEIGADVEIIGYPGGGRLTSSTGKVLAYEEDPLNANVGEVIVTSAPAEPGSSGSPLYATSGRVGGVVYAADPEGTHSVAVPVTTLMTLLDQATFEEAVPDSE